MRLIEQNDASYVGLFGEGNSEDGQNGFGTGAAVREKFNERFGWIYNVKRIADFEGVSMKEAWEIPVRQALNTLSYLKAYDSYMKTLK